MAKFVPDLMTCIKNISNFKHFIGISMGLLTALVILFTQAFYFDYVADIKSDVKTEQTEDSNDTDTAADLTISQDAVVSPVVQVSINQILPFISEISHAITDQVNFEIVSVPDLNDYVKVLFNTIISPNAP